MISYLAISLNQHRIVFSARIWCIIAFAAKKLHIDNCVYNMLTAAFYPSHSVKTQVGLLIRNGHEMVQFDFRTFSVD